MVARTPTAQPGRSSEKKLGPSYQFQWQNPHLLKSIYPARERKLLEFLLVFDEIDTVKEYNQKNLDAVVQEYKSLPAKLPNAIEGEPADETGKKLKLGQWYIDKFKKAMEKGVNTGQVLNRSDARIVKQAVMFFKMVQKFNKYNVLDQRGLLELVVEKFHQEPNRYPEWLVYMVIHFSGMRYKSAHASYYDPKNLVKVLRPEIKDLSDDQALVELVKLKDELEKAGSPIPGWAWHEIVKLTPLRLKYAQEDWETYKKELASAEDHRWDQILRDWEVDITQWRKKHWETYSMIVTRAVCNEVGEHIQHLRGLHTSAGISRKTDWYNKQKTTGAYFIHQDSETDFQPGAAIFWMGWYLPPPGDHEVVRKLSNIDLTGHISPGTVKHGTPKFREEWTTWDSNNMFIRTRKLRPTQADKTQKRNLKKGITLNKQKIRKLQNKLGKVKDKEVGERKQIEREIRNHTRSIERDERQIDEIDKKSLPTRQYLHWPHEAIVVNVEELITGRRVITFETYDGTMGINERRNMMLGGRDQDVFIGYHPTKELSAEMDQKLVEMIRWDKILQNPDYPTRLRPSLDAGEGDLDSEGEAADRVPIMVTAKNGINLKDNRVLERGTIFQGVARETKGVKTYRVSECETEPNAVGLVLKDEQATPLERCFWVEVNQATDCKTIKDSNRKGFPRFGRFKPKTDLAAGQRLLVSANHQVNKSDLNGRIQGTGKTFWYLILHPPDDPEAAGLYVYAGNIVPVSRPAPWTEIQAQIKAGKMPGEVEEAEEKLVALEAVLMVTKPTGIDLGEGKVIARGAKLLARERKKAGLISYRVTACDSEPGAVGQVVKGEDVSQLKSGFWVELVKEANAKNISGVNRKGFPTFAGVRPKVILEPGQITVVSSTHQVNKTDLGGRVQGDGRQFWYLILEHPEKPEAAGLFIPVESVRLLSTPADWVEVQAQVQSGQFPGAEEDDESVSGTINLPEEPVMVISEAGIKLSKDTLIPRGTVLHANLREVNEEISYRVTRCEAYPDAVGKVLSEGQASLLDKCFWVKTKTITGCQTISDWNKKGFPIFNQKMKPVIKLPMGKPLLVSASHEFNDSDVGGLIKGNGDTFCYLILEHPEKPEAAGLYVLAEAVLQQTNPEEWEDIHKKVSDVVSTNRAMVSPV